MNGANVVVGSHHSAGEAFQNDAESSRCDVKGAGLEPDTIRVRHPETIIFQLDVSNEVFAAPSIRIEAVGEIAEGSDRHMSPFLWVNSLGVKQHLRRLPVLRDSSSGVMLTFSALTTSAELFLCRYTSDGENLARKDLTFRPTWSFL
jgi:hypothetical protein